jgi:MFS transporter, DHA1 family, multidrug resistance protein
MWFTLIISAGCLVLALLVVRETYEPILLSRKAARLRVQTKDWGLHAQMDEQQAELGHLVREYGLKPIRLLIQEPILVAITLYNSYVYGVIYLTFEAFPYAFGVVRGWSPGIASLPFLSLFVGEMLGFVATLLVMKFAVGSKIKAGKRPVPEDHLWTMMVGSVLLIGGFFWFAWTSQPSISWIPQVLAGPVIGCGIYMVFLSCQIYITECYLANTNSAVAANTLVRSAVAGAFPLFATQMFEKLDVDWASSLLGFLCVAMTPFPILFYFYGAKMRSWSKFAAGEEARKQQSS